MFIEPALAKGYQRIDGNDDDALVELALSAAEKSAVVYMNRQVYKDQAGLDAAVAGGSAGLFPIVVTDDMKLAMLILFGHFYANREAVVVGVSVAALPNGPWHFLDQYRILPGV
jgi:hypothetical protein